MTTPPVTPHVRRASAADVARVAPLFDAYRVFYGKPSDVDAARAFLEARLARDESVILVAVNDADDAVGFTQLYRSFSSVSLGTIVVLNDLYVVPAWRRSGAARALVLAAAEHAAREGALRLELSTQHDNAPARRLYESLGFVQDTEFAHLSLTLEGF